MLLPFYAAAMTRLVRGRDRDGQARLELAVLAVSAVAAVAVRGLVHHFRPESVFGNQLPGTWTWFVGGLTLAVASAWLRPLPVTARPRPARFATEHPLACWGLAFACLTIAAWWAGLGRHPFAPIPTLNLQFQHVLYAGVAFFLVAPMVFHDGRRSLPATLLSTRFLAWLGLVSYGIFLYHQPLVFAFLDTRLWPPVAGWVLYTVLVVAGTIVLAAASYYAVERPLLRFKEPRKGGTSSRTRAHAVPAKSES